jgi:hypothetical protein
VEYIKIKTYQIKKHRDPHSETDWTGYQPEEEAVVVYEYRPVKEREVSIPSFFLRVENFGFFFEYLTVKSIVFFRGGRVRDDIKDGRDGD